MSNVSHSKPRPAASLIALFHRLGLARAVHPLMSFPQCPTQVHPGSKAQPQILAGRWPDLASLLARRLAAMHPNAAPGGNTDQEPVE
jgi:hypothetical protein